MKKMAKGGTVSQDALDLADLAASGMPIGADPEMIQAALEAATKNDASDLSDIAASGMPVAADTDAIKAGLMDARGYSSGGVVEDETKDIPEDIKEYIDAVHKERQEARPDEGWRMKPQDKPESMVPYKRNEDAEPSVIDQMRPMAGMADGGVVDPNQDLQDIANMGGGDPFMPPIAENPVKQAPAAPPAPVAAPVAPAIKPPPAPALTDQDYMDRANKMLGLNPQEQAGFMKLLGQSQQKSQIGAALAGVGDAIASGGTLGKVNPGALNRAEEISNNATKQGIEGMQTIRGNQEKSQELADKLETRDPNSPLSKWAQKAYGDVGKKLGLNLSNASAALIGDVSGKGVEALNTEFQNQLKMMQVDLQKQTLAATKENQKSERDIARQGQQLQATKDLGSRTLGNKVEGIIPGTPANTEKKSLERIASGEKGPVPVNSRAEYDALPSGTHYVDSHGTEKIKK